jgi:hypothetical protein
MKRINREEKLKRYKEEIEFAVRWRTNAGYDQTWHEIVDLYKGRQFSNWDDLDYEDRSQINVAFSTLNVIYPSVSINHPKIGVFANQPLDEDKAVIAEAIMNYWWGHHNFHEGFRLAVKDFLMLGIGWVKVGWSYVESTEEMDEYQKAEAFDEQRAQLDEFAASNPALAASLPTDEEIMASVIESNTEVVLEDRPTLDRISPLHIYVNPDATCMNDVCWIAQRLIMPLEEVKEDKRYRLAARKRLKAQTFSAASWITQDERDRYHDQVARVIVWEYYNLKDQSLCVFAEGSDEFLVEPMEIPFAFGHPFIPVFNFTVPDEFYPIGDLEMIIPMNDELNHTRTQLMNYRRKFGRKYVYRERAFDAKGIAALQSNADNVAVPVVDEQTPLSEVIQPMQQTTLDPNMFIMDDRIKQDMYEVSGVSEYRRGGESSTRKTATEAAIINDAANARSAEKLAVVEMFVSQVARKILQIAQQFLTGDQVARVVGKEGQMFWVPFEREDILGEYDFKVEAGSTQPFDENARRQQAVALMATLAPLMQMGVLNPVEVARHVLREGFGVRNPEKFMMPQAQQMMMAQQQAQLAAMQQEAQPEGGPPQQGAPPSAAVGADAPQLPPEELLARQQGQQALPQLEGQVGLAL